MSSWQLIFLQSKANNGYYDEKDLPPQIWEWPQETWFQERLRYVRGMEWGILRKIGHSDLDTTSMSQ